MLSRRKFLVAAATVSAAAAAAYIAKPHFRQLILPKLDTTYPLGVLQDIEMHNISALGETVVAQEFVPPVDFFQDFVNAATQSESGLLKEYERASELLNKTSVGLFEQGVARQQFAELPLSRRNKVLQALLWQYSGSDWITPKVEKLVVSRDALALRMYVMQPLIEYYYRSPYGWAVVGYEISPGQPRDSREYTRLPGDKGVF
jgi:hypothetical protein